jgi:hemerythrin-like domain-containing protein
MDARVESNLNTNIKDLINSYPSIQDALDKYDIGCAPCSLGTCKLKDVVGIHNMTAENEKELITTIFDIIYPDEKFDIPRLGQDKKSSGTTAVLSPPLRMLVEEHKLIKRVLALIPEIIKVLDLRHEEHKQIVRDVAGFIRNYADKFHHAKEEDILFREFDASLDIIKVMISDHIQSRNYVSLMLQAVETENTPLAQENLSNYSVLLNEHIQKEDTILYPWMDKNLETKQVGEMYSAFYQINSEKQDIQPRYEKFVSELEEKFK